MWWEEDHGVKMTWVYKCCKTSSQVPRVHGALSQGSSAGKSAPCEQRHSVIREVISLVITKVISLIVS